MVISSLGLLLTLPSYAETTSRLIVDMHNDSLFTKPNCEYIINTKVDLRGKEISLPENCSLVFRRKGVLYNGSIIGNYTKISGLRRSCLGIVLKGTWILPSIEDVIFSDNHLTDNQILDNIYVLQSDDIINTIVLTKPEYRIVLSNERNYGLKLKKNTTLYLKTTLFAEGNDLPLYTIISVSSNTVIYGGSIIGDVGRHTYVDGSTSQWGMGIKVYNSENVTIDGVHISKCTGDGIYIGGGVVSEIEDYSQASKSIIIKDVVSNDNRRQGISITCADGVYVENSIFSNTGRTESVAPGCGLDVEPNKGQSVRNIHFKNCKFLNNNIAKDVSIGGYSVQGDKCSVRQILLEDCEVTGTVCVLSGSVVISRCSMRSLRLHLVRMPKEKVSFDSCQITNGSGVSISTSSSIADKETVPEYSFKDCTLSMNEASSRCMFSMINHKGNEVAIFRVEDCDFSFPAGSQQYDMVQAKMNLSFYFKNCNISPNGRKIDLNNSMYVGCWVKP